MRILPSVAVAALAALLAGCQADPDSWTGGLKLLNVHAIAFTPDGGGLVMVGPRASDDGQLNTAAYYHLNLASMHGRRLGYGQYSLGQALLCPFEQAVAVPSYCPGSPGEPDQPGYDLYDLTTARLIRRAKIDDRSLFVGHDEQIGPTVATAPEQSPMTTQPDASPDNAADEKLLAAWEAIWQQPLNSGQLAAVAAHRPRWVARGHRNRADAQTAIVDGQTFYTLDSPDGRRRLFIRFNAPGSSAGKAANPDGDGFAYGFLHDPLSNRRHMLYTTSGADETLEGIGSVVFGGPVWLFRQPIRWFRGQ